MMGNCKDCKNWQEAHMGRWPDREEAVKQYRVCTAVELQWGWRWAEETPSPLAWVSGEGSDFAAVYTKPDFGCVLFEGQQEA